jgi:hypothetical protein
MRQYELEKEDIIKLCLCLINSATRHEYVYRTNANIQSKQNYNNSVALVSGQTITIERPQFVGEGNANFFG